MFSIAHFFASFFGIPGGCTFLNILAGMILGFIPAVFLIYPLTLLSASAGYFVGINLGEKSIVKKYAHLFEMVKKKVLFDNFQSLILIRLSPLLPFGILNLCLGVMKIPFLIFISTTFVGIFFDVVLLAGIGALASGEMLQWTNFKHLTIIAFLSLFTIVYIVKIFFNKIFKKSELD